MPAAPAAANSRRPTDSDFYQQRLKAWQPILTPRWVVLTFLIIGAPFIAIGYFLKVASDNVIEYSVQYDGAGALRTTYDACHVEPFNTTRGPGAPPCIVTFNVAETMKAPVYLYYELANFYQNHRRYVKSRSDKQLAGTFYTESSQLSDCDPLRTLNGKVLNPCGLIANSVFNDTFTLLPPSAPGGNASAVTLDETGIAWPSDLKKFVDPTPAQKAANVNTTIFLSDLFPTIQNVTNEHFIVWMRVAALPNFRKLYGRINSDIPAGTTLQVRIAPAFPVTGFDGKKSLVLSTTSFLGGKNPFLGIAYMVVGGICVALALVFLGRQAFGGRRLGDTTFLVWNNRR